MDGLDGNARFVGGLDGDERGAGAKNVHALLNDRLVDLLPVEERSHGRVGVTNDELGALEGDRAMAQREVSFIELDVAAFSADPERMLVDGEGRTDGFLRATGHDAERARNRGLLERRGRRRNTF